MAAEPRFLDCGEAALSVEFGDAVDPAINARVLALDDALRAAPPKGLRETTPTYRSLFVRYEPLEVSRTELVAHIIAALATCAAGAGSRDESAPALLKQRWVIPCCYDPALAEDIVEAASLLSLTPAQLAARHAGSDHRAYMYGFAPGWLYLGEAPAPLRISRRAAPRPPTPPGAVLIGGGLSLIAANPMPTGWYVIGRTPERLFSLARMPNFLIAPGDEIRFEAIDTATFSALDARAAAGELVSRKEDA